MPPRCRIRLVGKPQRQIGQRADVDGDDAELLGAVQFDRIAEQTEAGIVDDVLDLDACGGQRRGDLVAGIGLFEIAGNHDRRGAAGAVDFAGQRRQTIRAPRHQRDAMAVGCENARQFGAYARRGSGNQRHTLSHDSMLLNSLARYAANAGTRAYAFRRDASHLQASRRIARDMRTAEFERRYSGAHRGRSDRLH